MHPGSRQVAWVVAAVALWAMPARADVYTWTDEHGTVHFTEEPPPSSHRGRKVPLPAQVDPPAPEREPPKEAAEASRAPGPAEPRPAPRPKRLPTVELFATRWCPYCQQAREYFRQSGVPFVEHDIEQDRDARERKIALTGSEAVPTVLIGTRVIVGFRPAEFQRALEQ